MKTRDQSELVNIGKISTAVGLRGEVRVTLYAEDSDNLKEGKVLLLKREDGRPGGGSASAENKANARRAGASQALSIEGKCLGVRYQGTKGAGGIPVIRIEGVSDRNAAESLRGMEVCIEVSALEPLPKGQHYVRDIVGYEVYDRTSGRTIGVLQDVIQNTAQNILDIAATDEVCGGDEKRRQILVPAVDAFLKTIDDERGVIELELIPGFAE